MSTKLIVAPTVEPVDVTTALLQVRQDGTPPDQALIVMLISSARRLAEHETGRALVTQTWQLVLDAFPAGAIALPRAPLQAVSSVSYLDTAGVVQTLPAGKYKVDAVGEPGRIAPAYGESWPATRADLNAVTIQFDAGYGAAAAVPDPIKTWMLAHISYWYDNRAAASEREMKPLPFLATLLDPFRIYSSVA